MTQKTKTILLVVIIFIATVGLGFYMFQQKEASKRQESIQSQAGPSNKTLEKPQNQGITGVITGGTVSSVTADSIEIKNGEEKSTYAINKNTAVVSVDGKKIERKSITDIKKGDKVSIMLNESDKSIVAIQIGKDAGSVF